MINFENIIERAVREAVADHLEKHPLTIPVTAASEPATRTPDHQDEGPRYYTRQQAAQVAKISLPTLHALHNEGLVAFIKIGRSTRIDADKFDAALRAGKFSNLRHRHA